MRQTVRRGVEPSHPPVLGLLQEHFQAACAANFARAEQAEEPGVLLRGEWVVSIMPFDGEQAHGSLCLVARRDAATALAPDGILEKGADVRDVLCDVVGERSNLLAARLKHRLLSHGVVLTLGVPTTAFTTNLHLGRGHDTAHRVALSSGCGPVYVMLAVAVAGAVSRAFALSTAPGAVAEGELVLL